MPSQDALSARLTTAAENFEKLKRANATIDMTRGKPAPEQLDLSNAMLNILTPEECADVDGQDYRNYGIGDGIPAAKKLFADFMGVQPDEIIVGGNSSLNLMYDVLSGAMLFGLPGSPVAWSKDERVAVLCPVPGYDRHFAICEQLGIEMIPVPMTETGPDMDMVEKLVAEDGRIRAIWCVPKYSNPTGVTYSDETVDRLAGMKTAAPDFRVLWDNAYTVHHLGKGPDRVKDILAACKAAGNPERAILFGSTSKITWPGAGVAVVAGSKATITDLAKKMSFATIGPDKVNQLRQVKFFGDLEGIVKLMDGHAAIIGPKFDAVNRALEERLGGLGVASWSKPEGGYFVSVDVLPGCASAIIAKAAEAGLKLTPAGATWPYGKDPEDSNLRLAPTMPSVEEIERAMEIFCTCVELVCLPRLPQ
jgi:DNA-binding transcriptional MocR family regulator